MSLEAIREITVSTPDGAQVPLGQLADIQIVEGPAIIYREDGGPVLAGQVQRPRPRPGEHHRRGPGQHRARDPAVRQGAELGEAVPALRHAPRVGAARSTSCTRPRGGWQIIIPLTILLITFLTYSAVKTWVDTVARPHRTFRSHARAACWRCWSRTMNFSVSAAMGFISIFGIAIQDAILVVTYFQRLRGTEGHAIEQAAREAAEKRLRPVLMTTLVAMIGLFPAARLERHRLADAEAAGHRGHRRRADARGRRAHHPAAAARRGPPLAREARRRRARRRTGRALGRPTWTTGRRDVEWGPSLGCTGAE